MNNRNNNSSSKNTVVDPNLLDVLKAEVSSEATPALQFLAKNGRTIILLTTLFVLCVSGGIFYQWYLGKTLAEYQISVGAILVDKEGREKVEILTEKLNTAPKELTVSINLEIAKTEEYLGNYEVAAAAWDKAAKAASKAGDSPTLDVALLGQAGALIKAKKFSDALIVLENLEKRVSLDFLPIVTEYSAMVQAKLGNNTQSISLYKKLQNSTDPVVIDYYAFIIEKLEKISK